MLKIYKSFERGIKECEDFENGCWINLVSPTQDEVMRVAQSLDVPYEFITAALDANEKPRIETEDGVKLILIDIPVIDNEMPEYEAYSTIPLGFIVTKTEIITVCTMKTSLLGDIAEGKLRDMNTGYKSRFIFRTLIRAAQRFLMYLTKIEGTSNKIEKQLNETLKNKELLQLLALSKSLIYFKASLKSNEAILRKMLRVHILKLYEEDEELLEDALIEISQAIDMASSYAEVLNATTETYSSVVSNNLNLIMKLLAIMTIVMTVPTMIFGFYGMNIDYLPFAENWWWPTVFSLLGGALIYLALKAVKYYK